jgi:hypothetical protein
VDFLTAAVNLRCQRFNSTALSPLAIRKIAGDIIPAVPTTTTLAAALALQETLKLAQERSLSRHRSFPASKDGFWRGLLSFRRLGRGQQGLQRGEEEARERLLQRFRNSFFSLRQPEILSVSPVPAPSAAAMTLWNYFTVPHPHPPLCLRFTSSQATDETGREMSAEEITVADVASLLQCSFNASLASLLWEHRLLFDSGSDLGPDPSLEQLLQQTEREGGAEGGEEVDVLMEAVRGEERFLVPAPLRMRRPSRRVI